MQLCDGSNQVLHLVAPLFDMLNHDGAADSFFDVTDTHIRLRFPSRRFLKGEELCLNYRPLASIASHAHLPEGKGEGEEERVNGRVNSADSISVSDEDRGGDEHGEGKQHLSAEAAEHCLLNYGFLSPLGGYPLTLNRAMRNRALFQDLSAREAIGFQSPGPASALAVLQKMGMSLSTTEQLPQLSSVHPVGGISQAAKNKGNADMRAVLRVTDTWTALCVLLANKEELSALSSALDSYCDNAGKGKGKEDTISASASATSAVSATIGAATEAAAWGAMAALLQENNQRLVNTVGKVAFLRAQFRAAFLTNSKAGSGSSEIGADMDMGTEAFALDTIEQMAAERLHLLAPYLQL